MYMVAFHCFKCWNFAIVSKANRTREAFAIAIDNSDGMNIYSIESSYLRRYIAQISVSGISVAIHSVFGNGNESFGKGFGIQCDPALMFNDV